MKLAPALQHVKQGGAVETTFATNLEKGWIELSIQLNTEGQYFIKVVYDITESGLAVKTSSEHSVQVFLEQEQGITPDEDVWIKMIVHQESNEQAEFDIQELADEERRRGE